MKHSDIEQELRAHGIPFVNVDEAKRALFASARLDAFHFVAYVEEGSNWLIMIGERSDRNMTTMREWAEVFGDGFRAVFAVERSAGIEYRAIDGERLRLADIARHNPRTIKPPAEKRLSAEPPPNPRTTAPPAISCAGANQLQLF